MAARSKLVIRRKTSTEENLDSDQSLSGEEESRDVIFDFDCSKNLKSLFSHEKKVHSVLASQVDSLTGDGHLTIAASKEDFRQRNLSALPKEILPSKSEIINQLLETDHGRLVDPDNCKEPGYDSISDEEKDSRPRFPVTYPSAGAKRRFYNNLDKENQVEACEWSIILDEANELAGLHGKTRNSFNSSVVPEERRYHKGGRSNSHFKFSFGTSTNKKDISGDCSLSKDEAHNSCEEDIEGPVELDYFEHGIEQEDTVLQLMENILEESAELANIPEFHKQLAGASSVSELLEEMQKGDPSLRRTLAVNNIKEKERQRSSSKKSMCLGNRVLNNKNAPDFTGDISSEDEINQQYQAAQIVKGHTMADLFQEAFNASTEEKAEIPRSNQYGFHGRLQHVIKLEKDRQMEYLKGLQPGRNPSNESSRIIVKILSRSLEAKLTVCQCLFGQNSKNVECENGLREGFGNNGGTMKKTIIFSPTFCKNVELEVGSIVYIHRPWKEVQINGGETIIMCAYFSPSL